MKRRTPTTRARSQRRERGAAMLETAMITYFIMVVLVLMIFLGWNFRRMAQVTNMDRYWVWERATPGSPGPDMQGRDDTMRNPLLNQAFFEDVYEDGAQRLNETRNNQGYMPLGHETLLDGGEVYEGLTDEPYAYFNEFLDRNPTGIQERFQTQHEQISPWLAANGFPESFRTNEGHRRLNGDWRYVNGITYDSGDDEWRAGGYRVAPGQTLREVFYAEMDDGLERYDDGGNRIAQAIRRFYLHYPPYNNGSHELPLTVWR